jgi:toxin FitB
VPRVRSTGKTMPIKDSLIAATALTHDLIVVTRHLSDVEKAGVRTVDPSALRQNRPMGTRRN